VRISSSDFSQIQMSKPVLISVDDDPDVLRSVERDLRRRYGGGYRVMPAQSGQEALEALRKLKLRNDPVALLLADQRMPEMDGVAFLAEARKLYPGARRALLTAYADTDAAIAAINEVKVDHYLLKPWDPPEEKLYPVLDDLLDAWKAGYRPAFEGMRVVGHRWSPQTHQLKDFLGRNHIPFAWVDVESKESEVRRYLDALGPLDRLPVVVFPDGTLLLEPANDQVAEKAGLRTRAETSLYDLVIVGAGPARGARRPGGYEFAYRKLSGVSIRSFRSRPDASRSDPSPPLRRGNSGAAGGCRSPLRRELPDSSLEKRD